MSSRLLQMHDIHFKGNLTVYCGFKLGPQATHVKRLNLKTLGTLNPGSSNPKSAPRKKITAILNEGTLANLDIKILICDPLDVAVQWVLNTWFSITHYFCIPKAPIDSLKLPWLHLAGNVASVAGRQWDMVRVWTHYAHLCPCHDNLQLNFHILAPHDSQSVHWMYYDLWIKTVTSHWRSMPAFTVWRSDSGAFIGNRTYCWLVERSDKLEEITCKISAVRITPFPDAPSVQCRIWPPEKWPPSRISVAPSKIRSLSPFQYLTLLCSHITHCLSLQWLNC